MTLGETASKSLRDALDQRASAMLTDRLCAALSGCGDDSAALLVALEKVRTSLRLFVDERMAEHVDARVRSMMHLPDRNERRRS